mmetsp:Transcript_5756/g.11426  ORF Transcript_5756/g.11426 Transcript_5756/m.11426 type:complete len:87 (+) Transcript_5756:219-479(+)
MQYSPMFHETRPKEKYKNVRIRERRRGEKSYEIEKNEAKQLVVTTSSLLSQDSAKPTCLLPISLPDSHPSYLKKKKKYFLKGQFRY